MPREYTTSRGDVLAGMFAVVAGYSALIEALAEEKRSLEEIGKRRRAGLLKFPTYHAGAGYQSICDGLSRHKRQPPREARVPSIYSTTHRPSIDSCARRAPREAGNPARIQSENFMTQSNKPSNDASPDAISDATSSFSLEQYYGERLKNVRQHLPVAAHQLKAAGVARVDIYYDGCGDSGQIEGVRYFDAQRKWIKSSPLLSISEDVLRELFYDLLETRHAGWENNDGAFGEFEWDLNADTLKHSHSERYVECETTEHDGI